MSYYIYISRDDISTRYQMPPTHPIADPHDAPIPGAPKEWRRIELSAWLAVIEDDPELIPDSETDANWTGHPAVPQWWFGFMDGTIGIKGADGYCINKAIEIAEKLGAHVQGELGEYFDEPLGPEDLEAFEEEAIPPLPNPKSSLFTRLFRRGS